MGFQRARSAEQREERRRTILDTASSMLRETSVAELTLTALARRACLAKSAVLRYFDSREAVLLELLVAEWADWLDELAAVLPAEVTAGPVAERVEQVAGAVARTLVGRPVLGDLAAAQAAVLERNVSPDVAAEFKRAALAETGRLAGMLRDRLPELSEESAFRCAGAGTMVAGAAWTHTQPSAALREAYARNPQLAALKLDFGEVLHELLAVLLRGYLAR